MYISCIQPILIPWYLTSFALFPTWHTVPTCTLVYLCACITDWILHVRERHAVWSFWECITWLTIVHSKLIYLQILWLHFFFRANFVIVFFSLEPNSIPFYIHINFQYLFICWWTTKLIPIHYYSEYSNNKHWCTNISREGYGLLWIYAHK